MEKLNTVNEIQSALSWQRGAATLIVTIVLLLSATLLMVTLSKTSIMEQFMSANEVRSTQALEGAQAGIDAAMSHLNAGGVDQLSTSPDQHGVADLIPPVTSWGSASYQVFFCTKGSLVVPNPKCPSTPSTGSIVTDATDATKKDISVNGSLVCETPTGNLIANASPMIILACGWSDDKQGRHAITTETMYTNPIPGPPNAPVVSRGAVNVSGSATVTNYFTNLTIWSGQPVTDIGNSGKTFIRDPSVALPASNADPTGGNGTNAFSSCSSPPTNFICTTDKNSIGPDVIAQDPTLTTMTYIDMFNYSFNYDTLNGYLNSGDKKTVNNATGLAAISNNAQDTSVVMTGSGDTTLCQPGSCTNTFNLGNNTYGAPDHPVILIVNGNVSTSGGSNATIYGLLYVAGNLNLAGSLTVTGSASIAGAVSGTGSLDVFYDSIKANPGEGSNTFSIPSGTWKDWGTTWAN
jgi:Tfp pilus assembly protein PilX